MRSVATRAVLIAGLVGILVLSGCIADEAAPDAEADTPEAADPHAGHVMMEANTTGLLIEDAAGDTTLGPAPWAMVEPWADLVSVSIGGVTPDTFRLHIEVVDASRPFVDGVVSVHLRANGSHFFAGYGAVYPFEAGHGFYCPSDGDGNPTDACPDVEGTVKGNIFTVVLPRAAFGVAAAGSVIDETRAETGHHVAYRQWVPLDEAGPGGTYVFA